jgi:4-hydroxy-2-oxoheptanedioate aldolase
VNRRLPAVRDRLGLGESVYGIWSLLNSQASVEISATSGLDFVILDSEHGSIGFREIEDLARAAAATGTEVYVRVSRVDPVEIQRVLDTGISGILVPQVRTKDDVLTVVAACRLAPDGTRGYNPFTRAGNYRGNATAVARQSDGLLVGILIENAQAIENLDEILSVDGLALVYVGVYDLSCALGVPGLVGHILVQQAVEAIRAKAVERGVAVGVMVDSRRGSKNLESGGMHFFVFKPDTTVLAEAIGKLLEE